jgi:hypothetical protein
MDAMLFILCFEKNKKIRAIQMYFLKSGSHSALREKIQGFRWNGYVMATFKCSYYFS